jgi:MFS transporter, OFA family, oxalate/formate antiporter
MDHDIYAVRRWVTLAASTLAAVCCGFYYAWSVLEKPMTAAHGYSPSQLSLAFTIIVAMPAICTLPAGKLLQYMKPTTLLLISGGVLAAGTILLSFATSPASLYAFAFVAGVGGMSYPGATMSNLMRFFPERRGTASGVLTGGFGLGAVIWGPVTVALIEWLGYQWTLRLLGVLFFLIVMVCSRLLTVAPVGYAPAGWRHPEPSVAVGSGAGQGKDWKGMLGTLSFWLLALVFIIGLTSGLMVTAHASTIVQQMLKISAAAAGAFVSYLALGMVIGKVGWGVLSDRFGRRAVIVAMLVLAVAALLVLWQTATYSLVVIGIFVVGICYGGFLALISPVALDTFGPKHFPVNFGILFLAVAVASYAGPRLGATVAEANGGLYRQAFLIAAIMTVGGLCLMVLYVALSRRRPVLETAKASATADGDELS